jgi:hypothetical protein
LLGDNLGCAIVIAAPRCNGVHSAIAGGIEAPCRLTVSENVRKISESRPRQIKTSGRAHEKRLQQESLRQPGNDLTKSGSVWRCPEDGMTAAEQWR